MLYNIFDTEAEAITAQEIDFQLYIATKSGVDYIQQTTAWAIPQQRETDNKWVYAVCPAGVSTHTQEESQNDWFPEEEMV